MKSVLLLASLWLIGPSAGYAQTLSDDVIQELFKKDVPTRAIGPEEFIFPGYMSDAAETREKNLQRCRERPELFPLLVALSGEWPELYREVWLYRPDYAWKRAKKGDMEILGALEWSRREPILKGLLKHPSPEVRARALAMLFEHDGNAYLEPLKAAALERGGDGKAREAAATALVARGEGEFLLADPELETFEGRHFASQMQPRLKVALQSSDPVVRNNAARLILTLPANADSLRPLLAWLKAPSGPIRRSLVEKLGTVKLPESADALGDLLENSPDDQDRDQAAIAYAFQTGPAAEPKIRRALAREKNYRGYAYFDALASIGALKSEELVALLEQLVVNNMNPQTRWESREMLASWTSEHLNSVPGLGKLVARRAEELEAGRPELAHYLRGQIIKGEGQETARYLLERLHSGKATAIEMEEFLKQRLDDPSLEQLSGCALGIAVAANPGHRGLEALMAGSDLKAQLAVLAGARLLRQPLPLDFLQRCLANPDLKKYAGLYLAALDRPETRSLSGAEAFVWGADGGPPDEREAHLLAGIAKADGPKRIFLVRSGFTQRYQDLVLRIWPDRWEAVMDLDLARFRKGAGSNSELKPLEEYLRKHKVRDWPRYDSGYSHPAQFRITQLSAEQNWRVSLLMVSRMHSSFRFPTEAERPFVGLLELFENYAERSPIQYYDFADHPGGRLVCRAESDLNALACRESGPVVHTTSPAKWWSVGQGKLIECPEPHEWELSPRSPGYEGSWNAAPDWNSRYWLSGVPEGQIKVETDRLVVVKDGKEKRTIASGLFEAPVTSSDGRWLLVGQRDGKGTGVPTFLCRIDLASGKLDRLSVPSFENLAPLAYLPQRKRFLIYGGKKYWSLVETLGLNDNEPPNFFLVDPASGEWEQLHEGEFQPFFHSCPFQKADVPGKVWAARDRKTGDDYRAEVGRFDPNTFQFEPLASFAKLDPITPEILVHNRKIYMIHREDLLEFPLPGK